ncbi:HEAT repeat domain-containing protein [Streptomyces sp. NPDC051662]|uniref:HEAT repeat domain-containing protein n=1 Tax=Streptomyces sp. NPDC051662 TaxID=3154750 RepID=UPI00341A9D9E
MEEYAHKHGWPTVVDVGEDLPSGQIRTIEWSITGGAHLKFFEDDATRCPYFFIEADHPNLCLSMTKHALDELPVYSREDLLSAFDAAADRTEERRRALLMVALGAPHEFDREVYRRITEAMRDEDAAVRSAAIYAMSYSPAIEYLSALRELAVSDADEQVRREAQEMLDVFAQVGITSS